MFKNLGLNLVIISFIASPISSPFACLQFLSSSSCASVWFVKEHDMTKDGWPVAQPGRAGPSWGEAPGESGGARTDAAGSQGYYTRI